MAECIVIADDLTGANATGVLLKKMNYCTITILDDDLLKNSNTNKCDCLIFPTDSRAINKDLAYKKINKISNLLRNDNIKVYSKRIDSTLRGNLGSEADGILDALGKDYIAIVAPCFPSSGRIVSGGYLLVNGLPLHKTEAAFDPIKPVHTSNVADIFRQQSKYKVASIGINELMEGKHKIAERMVNLVKKGNRILTFDCITQEDLDLIADALISSKLKFVAVDPGVFTSTIARKLITPIKEQKKNKNKILALVGSINPVTKGQMEELWLSQKTYNVFINIKELLESEVSRKTEINRVADEILSNCDKNNITTVTGTSLFPENRVNFDYYSKRDKLEIDELSEKINSSFAEIAFLIFSKNSTFKGLYTSGGDITISVCERFGVLGLNLLDEVLPLAAYAEMLDGKFDKLKVITKGGMVGEKDAIKRCITYLKEQLFI